MKQIMDLDSLCKVRWGITQASATQEEGTSCVLFGGVIKDGGHCNDVLLTPSLF